MIVNIVDRRSRRHRFLNINAIVEAAWHFNHYVDGDKITGRRGPDYQDKENVTIADAVRWAQSFKDPVTLFLYDEGEGTTVAHRPPPLKKSDAKSEAPVRARKKVLVRAT